MIWGARDRRRDLIEELEEASRGLAAAALLTGTAAVVLATVPVAVLISGSSLDWLPPALTALAATLAGAKVVAAVWGVISSLE